MPKANVCEVVRPSVMGPRLDVRVYDLGCALLTNREVGREDTGGVVEPQADPLDPLRCRAVICDDHGEDVVTGIDYSRLLPNLNPNV